MPASRTQSSTSSSSFTHQHAAAVGVVEATVRVDPGTITNPAVQQSMSGVHFSPLDHQLFYVYSQMVYDESFEQAISEHTTPDGHADGYYDSLGAADKQPGVSMGWENLTNGGEGVSWIVNPRLAFNGNVSVSLTTSSSHHDSTSPPATASGAAAAAAAGPRVGIAARGLYHQGYRLHAGRDYQGYLAVKADRPGSVVHIRLEDWPPPLTPPGRPNAAHAAATAATAPKLDQGGDEPRLAQRITLAHGALTHPGGGNWQRLAFSLTPNGSSVCVPFPFGTPPLYCGLPRYAVLSRLVCLVSTGCIDGCFLFLFLNSFARFR